MSCGVGLGSGVAEAVATALLGPLDWELACAAGVALKRQNTNQKKKNKKKKLQATLIFGKLYSFGNHFLTDKTSNFIYILNDSIVIAKIYTLKEHDFFCINIYLLNRC